jgi:hypothetical protein
MCDVGQSASTQSRPGQVARRPGAPTSGVQTCCPDVAEFQKAANRTDYFGFDDKTDMVATGTDPYWVPAAKAKTAPSDRLTRDGAIWLSVEKGQTAKCVIDFTNNLTCISNCTYETRPGGKVTVVTSAISADRAVFEIRGDNAGDATVVVRCNGQDKGWVHVACHERLTFSVGMCEVNQSVTTGSGATARTTLTLPRPTMNVAQYQSFFDECYRAACIKVNITALPKHDVPASVNLSPGGGFFDANGQMESPGYRSRMATGIYPVTDAIDSAVRRAHPGYDKYLYLMIPPGARQAGTGYLNGFARGIGGNYAIFFNDDAGTYSTAAHEFGHTINLRHPNDSAGTGQYPAHLRAGGDNVPVNDVLNLMGYGNPRNRRKELRYKQWKAASGR